MPAPLDDQYRIDAPQLDGWASIGEQIRALEHPTATATKTYSFGSPWVAWHIARNGSKAYPAEYVGSASRHTPERQNGKFSIRFQKALFQFLDCFRGIRKCKPEDTRQPRLDAEDPGRDHIKEEVGGCSW